MVEPTKAIVNSVVSWFSDFFFFKGQKVRKSGYESSQVDKHGPTSSSKQTQNIFLEIKVHLEL
jgi:hypothetical protein